MYNHSNSTINFAKRKMNKKIFLGIMILGLFGFTALAQAKDFADVKNMHPNYEAISSLAEKGIVEGYADGNFKPDQNINRAEFLKIIVGSMYDNSEIKNCQKQNLLNNWSYAFFPDVKRDIWYADYVCLSKIRGFIQGYEDKTFKPSENINYVEALKIIFKANNDNGVEKPQGKEWYSPYLESANAYYIGLENISPDKKLTRGEMSQLIYNYMSKWGVGKYAGENTTATETSAETAKDQEAFDSSYAYSNTDLGFSLLLPSSWKDYELKTYKFLDDMCGNVEAEIYYFKPANINFEFNPNQNQVPLSIIRYKKNEYCTASYNWQQEAIDIYKQGDPTADPAMMYLGAVYSHSRTIQNDEYFYQIYPMQLGEYNGGSFVYTAPYQFEIDLAVASFSLTDAGEVESIIIDEN